MIATLARNDVVLVVARNVAHQQRLKHSLLLYRLNQLAQIAQHLARLIGIWANLIERNHPADCRAAKRRQLLDVVRVMPHLESGGQPYPLRHVE